MFRFGWMRSVTAAVAGAALLAVGCSTMRSDRVAYAPVATGTTWAVAQTNTGSYGSGTSRVAVRSGERTWEGERVLTTEAAGVVIMNRASDGLRIGALGPDGKPTFLLSPPVGPVFPLEPGKTWTTKTQMTAYPANRTFPMESDWKVHDFEDVKVPAGTFRTIRFAAVDRVGGAVWNDDTYWFSPDYRIVVKSALRRAPSHPADAGSRDGELVERPKMP